MNRVQRVAAAILTALLLLCSSCATTRVVTYRPPQVLVIDSFSYARIGTPKIVYPRHQGGDEVGSAFWDKDGLKYHIGQKSIPDHLDYMDIDSIRTADGGVTTLMSTKTQSVRAIYYHNGMIDRPTPGVCGQGLLSAVLQRDSTTEAHQHFVADVDSITVTYRRTDRGASVLLAVGMAVLAGFGLFAWALSTLPSE